MILQSLSIVLGVKTLTKSVRTMCRISVGFVLNYFRLDRVPCNKAGYADHYIEIIRFSEVKGTDTFHYRNARIEVQFQIHETPIDTQKIKA